MTSVDNIPMSKFISLRDLFKGNEFNLPSSADTIKQHVMSYHKEVQRTIISELNELKSNCNKFSLIFDEWTSTSNKHYINLILHSDNKFWNLGLTRFKFSLTSEACVATLQNELKKFNIRLLDALCPGRDQGN